MPGPSAEESDRATVEAVAPLRELIDELSPDARRQAVTHSSWTQHRSRSWGRPAFLGDSVLGLIVAAELYRRFPRSDIGRLTKIHGQAVSGRACAAIARRIGVAEMLAESRPEVADGGITVQELVASERAMASITEALIGAAYLEQGLARTTDAVLSAFEPEIAFASETLLDFKSALQERLARRGALVTYVVVNEQGPPHERVFDVEARVDGEVVGTGSGQSKKSAEQAAAEAALAAADD